MVTASEGCGWGRIPSQFVLECRSHSPGRRQVEPAKSRGGIRGEESKMQPAALPTERSADITAIVVATMRQLGVLGLPRNYEIFYEALSGTNRELSLAVVSLSSRPTQDELDQIGRAFFAHNHGPGIVEHARDVIA